MGEDEDRGAEHRVRAPPAVPLVVLPRAALRAELVAPHDLRADPVAPGPRHGVVHAGLAALAALHGAEGVGVEEPAVQAVAGVAERCLQALSLARAVAVERDREVVDADQGHGAPSGGRAGFGAAEGPRPARADFSPGPTGWAGDAPPGPSVPPGR